MPRKKVTQEPEQKRGKKGNGYLELRGKKYVARWSAFGKRYSESTGTDNYEEALAFLKERTSEVVADNIDQTKRRVIARFEGREAELAEEENKLPGLPINQMWNAFLNSPNRKKGASDDTLNSYKTQCNVFETWMTQHYPQVSELREVSQKIANEFAAWMSTTHSTNSYNKYLQLFETIWRVLDHNKESNAKLTLNPWTKDNISRTKISVHARRELTIEELQRVCGTLTGEMRLLFAIGIYTGLRLGDAATLEWGNVDLIKKAIAKKTRKTSTPVWIPIHPALQMMLASIPEQDRKRYVLPDTAERYLHGNRTGITHDIQRIFEACDITTKSENKKHARKSVDVGFHSLRHTFVSLSANAGVPLAIVQTIVGHGNPLMTSHYFHASSSALQSAVMTIPDIAGNADQKLLAADKVNTLLQQIGELSDDELKSLHEAVSKMLEERHSSDSAKH